MKRAPIHLIYHSVYPRSMSGCLPLFFILALGAVVGTMILFKVNLPKPIPPRGEGEILYRQDELTRFRVRQHSALPLRLPSSVDPAARLPIPEHILPLHPLPTLLPPPSQLRPVYAQDSFVLDDAYLLEFPPEETTPTAGQQKEASP